MTDLAHARRQLAFPVLFVLLWSTGFIAAKYGLPYAPPLTFLLYRFALVAVLMTAVALATGASWPQSLTEAGHVAVAAWLVHGLYLGGVFVARQQAAEHRIAVIARQAPPQNAGIWIDQRSGPAIADHRDIEPMIGHAFF